MIRCFLSVAALLLLSVAASAQTAAELEAPGSYDVSLIYPGPKVTGAFPPQLPAADPAFAGITPSSCIEAAVFYPVPDGTVVGFPYGVNLAAASGEFPLVVFMHGGGGHPVDYEDIVVHVASHGFIVVSVLYSPDVGVQDRPAGFAIDAVTMVNHVYDDQTGTAFHPLLQGHVRDHTDQKWVTMGHSYGAVASMFLIADDRFKTVVAFQPAEESLVPASVGSCPVASLLVGATFHAHALVESYDGGLFILEGSLDNWTPLGNGAFWFDRGPLGPARPSRSVLFTVPGMGHFGATDFPLAIDPSDPANNGNDPTACGAQLPDTLPQADQNRLHRRVAAGVLLAETGPPEAEQIYESLLGSPMTSQTDATGAPLAVGVVSRCEDPILWYALGPSNDVTVGIAGIARDLDILYFAAPSLFPGVIEVYNNVQTGNGLPASGIRELFYPITVPSGTLTQVAAYLYRGGPFAVTRIADLTIP